MKLLNKHRVAKLLSILLLITGATVNAQAATSKVNSACSRVGISTISEGVVLTCTASGSHAVWKVKAKVKIGTKLAYQNIMGDPCSTLNESAIYNGVSYICKSGSNGVRWELSPYILVDTKLAIQSIQDQLCAVPRTTTLLNGIDYTCQQQGSIATWQETPLVSVNTKLAASALAGTKCAEMGSITLLKGTYFKCGSNKRWAVLAKQVFPKEPVQPKYPASVCVNLSTIEEDIARTNSAGSRINGLYQKYLFVKQQLASMNPPAAPNSPAYQNNQNLRLGLKGAALSWLSSYQKTIAAITRSRPSCQSEKSKLTKIPVDLANELGITLP